MTTTDPSLPSDALPEAILPPPVPSARPPVPAAGGPDAAFWLRFIPFLVLAAAVFLFAGRRWAASFDHFRLFRPYAHPELLAPAPVPAPRAERDVTGLPAAPKGPRSVLFRLEAPQAGLVLLGGTFNNFNAAEHPLARKADGVWETAVELSPGRYLYKFKVDGAWVLDPANPERNPAPRDASVLELQ